jgi:hypothetical protein
MVDVPVLREGETNLTEETATTPTVQMASVLLRNFTRGLTELAEKMVCARGCSTGTRRPEDETVSAERICVGDAFRESVTPRHRGRGGGTSFHSSRNTMLRRVHHGDAGALWVSRAGFETIATLSLVARSRFQNIQRRAGRRASLKSLVAASPFATCVVNWTDRPLMDHWMANLPVGVLPLLRYPSSFQERRGTLNAIAFREKARSAALYKKVTHAAERPEEFVAFLTGKRGESVPLWCRPPRAIRRLLHMRPQTRDIPTRNRRRKTGQWTPETGRAP